MKIIIVGGGKLGKDIADNMLERKYDVRLIEKDRAKCIELANDLDVEIICGDGTELEVLEEAGTKNADCFISVTGSDQDNFCLLYTSIWNRWFTRCDWSGYQQN